ncbi:hypothetical protein ACFYZ6_25700 [Streptomyces rubiginosohelvolus]|uniref:hypothetical protein n=1 Tax=Streptomyces rubiginosohelvolus TaxID=67362 RepID=UPI0036B71E5C
MATRASDAGADATVELGRRVFQRLWRREEDQPELRVALDEAVAAPGDTAAQDALRAEIRRLLHEDASLAKDVAALLAPAPASQETYQASGQGSVVLRENHGVINLGGDMTIQR